MTYRVFLSHNAVDADLVTAIKRAAAAVNTEVYTYDQDIQAGADLPTKLLNAIRRSDALVALLTQNAMYRPAVQQEIGCAVQQRKPVIALVEKGLNAQELTLVQGLEHIPLDPRNPDEAWWKLQRSLTGLRDSQAKGLLWLSVIVGVIATVFFASKDDETDTNETDSAGI